MGALIPIESVSVAILMRGPSARIGQTKGLLPWIDGEPIVSHLVARFHAAANRIVIGKIPPPLKSLSGAQFVQEPAEPEGPAVGALAAVQASETDWNLLLAADMPQLDPRVIQIMQADVTKESARMIMIDDGEALQPLPCLIHRRFESRLAHQVAQGRTGLRQFQDQPDVCITTLSPSSRDLWQELTADFDTWADYEIIMERARQAHRP